jgi:hypothetical protein
LFTTIAANPPLEAAPATIIAKLAKHAGHILNLKPLNF